MALSSTSADATVNNAATFPGAIGVCSSCLIYITRESQHGQFVLNSYLENIEGLGSNIAQNSAKTLHLLNLPFSKVSL